VQGNPRGGNRKVLGNAELLFPFPGLVGERSARMSWFVDTGMATDKFELNEMRVSTGLGVLWISPMGPLKVSFALQVKQVEGDKKQIFQFTFGGAF